MLSLRRVLDLVMDGIPILNLGDEMATRGINPTSKVAKQAIVPRRSDDGKLNWGDKNASQHSNGFDLGPRRCYINLKLQLRDNAVRAENNVHQSPQKKRKFSPILCDIEEKEVRTLSRNRVTDAVTIPSSPLPHPVVKRQLVCANLMENSPPKSKVSDFGSIILSSVPGQQCQDDQENNLMGSWEKKMEKIRSSLSLESGEFEREELEGGAVLSNEISSSVLSVGKDEDMKSKFELDSVTGIDEMCDEDAFVQSDLDIDESAGRGMNMLLGCRSVYEYERLNKISEETYGIVYRAKDKKTGEIVALKKVNDLV
ncbi:hypothetical protein V6N13_030788 [Hibiscus sabdariffa]